MSEPKFDSKDYPRPFFYETWAVCHESISHEKRLIALDEDLRPCVFITEEQAVRYIPKLKAFRPGHEFSVKRIYPYTRPMATGQWLYGASTNGTNTYTITFK